ncbi:sugar ABC transporter ATP-binding protein [bacterium]|nr:sugar ABC transporter ATP-binding protein [bacterium]
MAESTDQPLLAVRGARKEFPGVLALADASFDLRPGEVHALVGENGAGKSTLIKLLTGVHPSDGGNIELFGEPSTVTSPIEAQRLGLATIYQEFTLVPGMTVRENLWLGREHTTRGFTSAPWERRSAAALFERLGVKIDPDSTVRSLPVSHQQLVEIGRALLSDARILIMDEPTASLSPHEVTQLFAILRDLREQGLGILFISHRLEEVFALADRVTVLRDGNSVGSWPTSDLTREQLIEHMVGRPLDQEFPKVAAEIGEAALEVRQLRGGHSPTEVGNSFTVRAGEVVGLFGLVGSGRTELARLIAGADRIQNGEVRVDGEAVQIRSPRDAIRAGICLLSEDRKAEGLVLNLPSVQNFALPSLSKWSRSGWLNEKAERAAFLKFVDAIHIRISDPEQPAGHLSGGNQQKLLIARWLEVDTRVILFDEPTRGIDVGAKAEIYQLINELAARGKAILMISSELPEVLGMADRILVMHEGRISGQLMNNEALSQQDVMQLAVA